MFKFLNRPLNINQRQEILAVWLDELQTDADVLQIKLEKKKRLIKWLTDAKKEISSEIFNELFVPQIAKIDWVKLCELAESTLSDDDA